jgi:hypothetical protein
MTQKNIWRITFDMRETKEFKAKQKIHRATNKNYRNQASVNTTNLLSTRSVLFPTSTMITSLPLSVRTSSIHLDVFKKDCLPTT